MRQFDNFKWLLSLPCGKLGKPPDKTWQAMASRLADLRQPGCYDYLRVSHSNYLNWAARIRCCL